MSADKVPLKFDSVESISEKEDGSVEFEISPSEFKSLCSYILFELSRQIEVAELSDKKKNKPSNPGNIAKMVG